jgi:hypothetical protein
MRNGAFEIFLSLAKAAARPALSKEERERVGATPFALLVIFTTLSAFSNQDLKLTPDTAPLLSAFS